MKDDKFIEGPSINEEKWSILIQDVQQHWQLSKTIWI